MPEMHTCSQDCFQCCGTLKEPWTSDCDHTELSLSAALVEHCSAVLGIQGHLHAVLPRAAQFPLKESIGATIMDFRRPYSS